MRGYDMFTDEERLLLWLNYGTEHDTRRYGAVLARFPELDEAYALFARKKAALFGFLPERSVSRLMEAAQDGFLDRFIARLVDQKISVCFLKDAEYPALLREIHNPPNVLYYRGRLVPEPPLALAIVGTRRPSEYGRDVSALFAHALARAGVTVVSGMATGIDACAARGALDCKEADYPTVAVLGTGVDEVYPSEHVKLYEEIAARGAVLSEFLPGTTARPQHFPIRNRIISGMSGGVLVVEAGERSGSTITAGFALEEGREVFAIPGRITDATSLGTNRMICRGEAKPVCSAEEILAEYDGFSAGVPVFSGRRIVACGDLSAEQQAVVRALKTGERSFDELSEQLPLTPGALNSALTELTFSGIMKQLPGRRYALDTAHTQLQ